jgi:gluconolactonase
VYRVNTDGSVDLIDDQTRYPNGIALAPGDTTLYVTNSDRDEKLVIAYDVAEDGSVGNRRVLAELTDPADGNPDGLKVDVQGNLFVTGPGGVWVLAPDGTQLGAILTGVLVANLGWGDDGSTLYLTADNYLMRVRTGTRGSLRTP